MGISIGMVGLGAFGGAFAGLFKAHPLVDRIAFCDCEPERIRKFADDPFFADKFNPKDVYSSLDEICRSDLDAIVIITQPWLHAPQCIQVMESGKDVYSAVPLICLPDGEETLEWCDKIIRASLKTGKHLCLAKPPASVRRRCSAGKRRWRASSAILSMRRGNTATTLTADAVFARFMRTALPAGSVPSGRRVRRNTRDAGNSHLRWTTRRIPSAARFFL